MRLLLATLLCACSTSPPAPTASSASADASVDAAVSAPAPSATDSAAAPPLLDAGGERILDWAPDSIWLQRVRGDTIWLSASKFNAEKLALCLWNPGQAFSCRPLAGKLPRGATPHPLAVLGSQTPYLYVYDGDQTLTFDASGELVLKTTDSQGVLLHDGSFVMRDGLRAARLDSTRPTIVRYATPTSAPAKVTITPDSALFHVAGDLALWATGEDGARTLYGRTIGEPLGPEEKLGALEITPDPLFTAGCSKHGATTAVLAQTKQEDKLGRMRGVVAHHAPAGWRGPVAYEMQATLDMSLVAYSTRGLACEPGRISWVILAGREIQRLACDTERCAIDKASLASIVPSPRILAAPLLDKVALFEPKEGGGVSLRVATVADLDKAPARVLLTEKYTHIRHLVPGPDRVLALITTSEPEGMRAIEITADGNVSVLR